MNNMERTNTRKTNTIQHRSVFKVLRQSSDITDPLLIPLIFIFLSCCEKAYDNKEFSRENSNPHSVPQITTH